MNKLLQERVYREKVSNEEDDIVARSFQLKQRFAHVWSVTARVRAEERRLLSSVAGCKVLDYGCGKGDYAIPLLKAGAVVDGIDISQAYIDACVRLAQENNIDPSMYRFQTMDAHRLLFEENTFDFVVGNGILHHLDFRIALEEVYRVLKPGGRAIFQEPLAGNPLLKLFRRLTPSARTPDERPVTKADLQEIEKQWRVNSTYYGLISAPVAVVTSILLRRWPKNPLLAGAEALERQLSAVPAFRSWNQYVLLNLIKPVAS